MAEDTTTYTYSCGDKSGFEYYVLGDDIRAEFAWTPYHVVNLYNEAGLPAKPFIIEVK